MAGKAGRPTGASDARERLIEEARRLFVSLPYSKVSTRMIAARADVNVALIRYYFGHKAGLYETMLRETMAPVQQQLQTMMTQGDFASIVDLLRTYYRIMAPNPDMPKLVARAMMMEPTDLQRQTMERIFSETARPAIERIFIQLQAQGQLHPDICPDKARMSFISLMIFPFLIPPSMLQLQGIEMDETYLAELAEHNVKLLTHGLLKPKEEG
ncbi:TetR/AcrR family transcriptional regulator [Photobacterium aphoticum]|uniref:TetR family transcriptional regulator n=2 Tax=Photobacterium aphoticum TaxID=754436 RepID=A0A0J1GGV2_9GAMM|nr:TetR/AcrR family transcriptional regulator [Photobacterium aphoticum]KLU98785.1 TetR family transcriptional regulator [Photobacterium aphoticum]PSU51918.1 TetR/AcrR family transcriptional regulator [Photobacterium aphoticum]GHA65358.1 TetR family transcriptional regulator [Photobacterium aphoticum]